MNTNKLMSTTKYYIHTHLQYPSSGLATLKKKNKTTTTTTTKIQVFVLMISAYPIQRVHSVTFWNPFTTFKSFLKSRQSFHKVSVEGPHFKVKLKIETCHLDFQNIFLKTLYTKDCHETFKKCRCGGRIFIFKIANKY